MRIKCGYVFMLKNRKFRNKIMTNILHIINRHAYKVMEA